VGVIDGINLAITYFMDGQIMRCGDLISEVSNIAASKMRAVDPRLRGAQGAALAVVQTMLESGRYISK
jgi:hypothetical protein